MEGLKAIGNRLFKKNTLFFAMYGSVGKLAFAGTEMASNQAILGIIPKEKTDLDLKYLRLWFESNKQILIDSAKGVALKNLSATIVKNLHPPLPPLATQKKIADLLDTADELRQKTKAIIDHYDQLAQSLFLEMFGDPVRNPKGFPYLRIKDLADSVKYGTSLKTDTKGQYPYLRMNNITYSGHLDFSNLKHIDLTDNDLQKYLVVKGDLLFNRTNSKELVGKTAIYNSDKKMVIAGYIIRVRLNRNGNPYYVWGFLNSKYGKLLLLNMCKNIVGMANINAQELQNIIVPAPPLSLQTQFAIRIAVIEQQKELAKQSLQESEHLFNVLLQKAFKGKIEVVEKNEVEG